MTLDSVRSRRATLARLWSKAATPTFMVVALLAAAGWRLLGWDWATPIVSAAAFATIALILAEDIFFDRAPWGLPRSLWRWVGDNSLLIIYPVAAVGGIVASKRLGWAWVIALTVVLGVAALLETAALILSRQLTNRATRRAARSFGTAVVRMWFDISATLMLTAGLLQHPNDHGASALHWLIPMCAVAAVADYHNARRKARPWPTGS